VKRMEDILREKDQTFEVTPSEEVWGKLEKSLDSKSRFSFWILPLLLTLGYGLLTLTSFLGTEQIADNKVTSIVSDLSALDTTLNSEAAVQMDKKIENSDQSIETQIGQSMESNSASKQHQSQNEYTKKEEKRHAVSNNTIRSSQVNEGGLNHFNNSRIPEIAQQSTPLQVDLIKTSLKPPGIIQYKKTDDKLNIGIDTLGLISYEPVKLETVLPHAVDPLWSVQLAAGVQRTYRVIKTPSSRNESAAFDFEPLDTSGGIVANPSLPRVGREFETPSRNMTFSLLAVHRKRNLGLRFGLNWSRFSYTIPYVEYTMDTVLLKDNIYSNYERQFVSVEARERNHENRMNYMSLTSGISYDLNFGKQRFTPYFDLQVRYAYSYSFGAYLPEQSSFYLFNQNAVGINTWNIAYEIGLEYAYQFGDSWRAFAAPFYSSNMISNSKHRSYIERFNAVGLRIGASYTIPRL
jgi:hypothetical protein